jgi:hypothetical protein
MKQKADFIIDSEITSIARGNITPELKTSCSGLCECITTKAETEEFKENFKEWVSNAEEQNFNK